MSSVFKDMWREDSIGSQESEGTEKLSQSRFKVKADRGNRVWAMCLQEVGNLLETKGIHAKRVMPISLTEAMSHPLQTPQQTLSHVPSPPLGDIPL